MPTPGSWFVPQFNKHKYDGEVEVEAGMVGVPKQAVYEELQVTSPKQNVPCGTNPRAKVGSKVTLQYIGFIYSPEKKRHGTEKVDASFRSSQSGSITFKVGDKETIAGLDQGIRGMCANQKRSMIIPPWLGFGVKQAKELDWTDGSTTKIPSHSWLTYYVKMVDVVGT
eukprot:g955.t1